MNLDTVVEVQHFEWCNTSANLTSVVLKIQKEPQVGSSSEPTSYVLILFFGNIILIKYGFYI